MGKKREIPNNFTSFCRLCLGITDDLIDITAEDQDYDIIELVFETIDIKFLKSHPLYAHQYVCESCLNICKFIKKFRKDCTNSLQTLSRSVIYEMPKDATEMCWTGDRKRMKELIEELKTLQEDSLIVQSEHYKEMWKMSVEDKDLIETDLAEEDIIMEIKNEIKEEIEEVQVETVDFDPNDPEFGENDGGDQDVDDEDYVPKAEEEEEANEEEAAEEMEVADAEQTDENEAKKPKRKKYKKFQCDICLKFMDGYDWKFHMNTHLKIYPFRCEEPDCDRKFTTPGNLQAHRKNAHNGKKVPESPEHADKLVPCEKCGLEFTKKQLYNHKKRQHADEQHECDEPDCGEIFSTLQRLKRHQKQCHSDKPRQKYTCELCGKAFRKTRLKYHMNIHLNLKPFVCNYEGCTKACPDPGQLAVHKRIIHLKTIKIVCKICGKPFKTKADHDIHFTYHGTPSLPCQICGRLLMNRKTLAKHLLIHTGEKKYKCTFEGCTKSFPVSTGLTVHMRSHTKEKPYACDDCPEKFAYRIGLRRHAQKVHGKVV
ncbi:zinc finger protein 260-like [Culicoides brevitarsis]|uniref:zinc finger protein 260-like n=1 Tax=Culicoides brevitarsis TaxID=469753 RepID=UPI00307B31B7